MFRQRLGDLTGAEIVGGEDERAWAVVRLTLSGQSTEELELIAIATSRAGGGVMASSSTEGTVAELPDMTAGAARAVAEELGILKEGPTEGSGGPYDTHDEPRGHARPDTRPAGEPEGS
jgi:hypothetical protein